MVGDIGVFSLLSGCRLRLDFIMNIGWFLLRVLHTLNKGKTWDDEGDLILSGVEFGYYSLKHKKKKKPQEMRVG